MENNDSQDRLSPYLSHMTMREGLSFSDYFDDSIPYDVKPVPCIQPMQEKENDFVGHSDIPTQSKDLFKGLWENNSEYIDPNADSFWVSPGGQFYATKSHLGWGQVYLRGIHKIEMNTTDDVYNKLFQLGFVRVSISDGHAEVLIDYGGNGYKMGRINEKQLGRIKSLAIEKGYSIYDSTKKQEVELNESLLLKNIIKEDVLKDYGDYWLDDRSRFIKCNNGHIAWAMNHLKNNGGLETLGDDPDVYYEMFNRHFIRVKVRHHIIYVEYNPSRPPSNTQWRTLKDAAIDSDMKLIDTSESSRREREIDLFESKHGKSLFIESMMPDRMDEFKSLLVKLFAYLKKELHLKTIPQVKLVSDEKNADKVLGKTAYYDPNKKLVVLYITNRHQKDILRSFSHEIIHHWQHENEKLSEDKSGESPTPGHDPQYAQNNPWLRQMEKQAYLLGNMLFRDWEDKKKAEDRKNRKKMAERTSLIGVEYPPRCK